MSLPPISVVIPAYNAAAHLARSLASVARADYPPGLLDLVVVDDGSTDGTSEIAQGLLAAMPFRSRVLRQENAGPSAARNVGWRESAGEWIQFLDADDEIAPGKLAAQGAVASGVDPDCAVVYSRWARRTEGMDEEPRDPDVEGDTLRKLIESGHFVPLGCSLHRRTWLEKVRGFDPALKLIEDVELLLRLAMAGAKLVKVPLAYPSFTYLRRDGSLSLSSPLAFYRGCVRNARLVESHWRAQREPVDGARARTLVEIYANGLQVFSRSDPHAFDVTLRDVLRLDPGFLPVSRRLRLLSTLVGVRNAYRLRSLLGGGAART